jgi:hypothetical protein
MLAENRFVVLCDVERQERYSGELETSKHQVEMLDDVVEVLKTCIRNPPLAVIVDMVSGRKMNGDAIVALTNLELSWPILRCRKKPGGGLMVISTHPINRAPFIEALDEISVGSPAWTRDDVLRKHVRLPVQLRARVMCGDDELWEMGTILNIGARGCFFHTYKSAEKNTPITVELRDLYDLPFEIKGRVAWARTWRQSPKLPGFGIVFEDGPMDHLVNAIMRLPAVVLLGKQ